MLRRKISESLLEWKQSNDKKALLVKGARQVGKTYIIREFAKENYDNLIELNFVTNDSYRQIFDSDLDAKTIYGRLSLFTNYGSQLNNENSLLFLDEIQACPRARTALKFLVEDGRFDIIASGSMLGIHYQNVPSYPTGYVDYLEMYPLDFEEFLWAKGIDGEIIDYLRNCFENKNKVDAQINNKLLEIFREYIVVGGMPDVVQNFVTNNNYAEVLRLQRNIVVDYKNDIAKYSRNGEKMKATMCYESIPAQLAKENKKFMYKYVEHNGRANKYLGSINWLKDAGIILSCNCLDSLNLPLVAYKNENNYKIYISDIGLLISQLDEGTNALIIEGNLGVYKGAIYENVIAQMLAVNDHNLYYYAPSVENEIDFVLANKGEICLLEVKATNGKTKSLNKILEKEKELKALKLIDGNVGISERILSLPLYMAMFL